MEAPIDIQELLKDKRAQCSPANDNATVNGIRSPFAAPKMTIVTAEMTAKQPKATNTEAYCPPGAKTTFGAVKAPETFWDQLRKGSSRQSVIFDNDDRSLFVPTGYPWQCIGKVRFPGGWGSGTVIGPRHVLTASHCVNWKPDGSPDTMTFTPGYYDGRGPEGEIAITEVLYWEKSPHQLTDLQVAFDYAILITASRIGDSLGHAGTRTYDSSWNGKAFWEQIGYPGEIDGGERPAIQYNAIISTKEDHSLGGHSGSALGNYNDFTPGQSGGPCWGFWTGQVGPQIVGIGSIIGSTNVAHPSGAASDNDYAGGQALVDLATWALANRV